MDQQVQLGPTGPLSLWKSLDLAGHIEVKDIAGELPLRFGLDGASCVATGAAAWAAGKRMLEALEAPMEGQKMTGNLAGFWTN